MVSVKHPLVEQANQIWQAVGKIVENEPNRGSEPYKEVDCVIVLGIKSEHGWQIISKGRASLMEVVIALSETAKEYAEELQKRVAGQIE